MRATAFHRSTHLNDSQLGPLERVCPFCGSEARSSVGVLQEAPLVSLLSCGSCQATSASRMPTDEALDDFYRQYYSSETEQVTFDNPARLSAHISNAALREWGDVEGRHLVIVDFGGGDGTISVGIGEALVGRGASAVEILLIDHCHTMATPKTEKVVVRLCEFNELQPRSADLVLASAILEHLSRPREAMAKLLESMRLGGIFYARTPYVVPLMRLAAVFGKKVDFTFPGHLHDMGRDFWDGVGRHFDLKLKTVSSTTSIVESTFDRHFARALAATLIKFPSKLFRNHYNYVGGWEVFLQRTD